ncbi:MAG: hypothetical protein ACREAY_08290 [Nitrososphaera sp.]|uniref:hypothetical protein n=1 Tax=Nitrososphaera sp. TaxID=1971748 RepID=UPI003D6F7916
MGVRSKMLVLAAYTFFAIVSYIVVWNTENPINDAMQAFFERSSLIERVEDCRKYATAMVEECVGWANKTMQYYLASVAMAISLPFTFIFARVALPKIVT